MLAGGIAALLLAVALGGYRQFCILMEKGSQKSWLPMVWYSPNVRAATWIVVTGCTLWSAYSLARPLGLHSFLGETAAVALIVLRWVLSSVVASRYFHAKASAGKF